MKVANLSLVFVKAVMSRMSQVQKFLGKTISSCLATFIYLSLELTMKLVPTQISFLFFPIWVFFNEHLRITRMQVKGEDIPLTVHYHFHPLHRHLNISRAITAESSPLHIASSRTRTRNL